MLELPRKAAGSALSSCRNGQKSQKEAALTAGSRSRSRPAARFLGRFVRVLLQVDQGSDIRTRSTNQWISITGETLLTLLLPPGAGAQVAPGPHFSRRWHNRSPLRLFPSRYIGVKSSHFLSGID